MIELCASARVSVFNASLSLSLYLFVPLYLSLSLRACVFALQCSALLVGLWHRFHSPAGVAFDKIIPSSS